MMKPRTYRDPARIEPLLAKVRKVWERYPDMRLSQLIVNACNETAPQIFYVEDSKLEAGLDHLLGLGVTSEPVTDTGL